MVNLTTLIESTNFCHLRRRAFNRLHVPSPLKGHNPSTFQTSHLRLKKQINETDASNSLSKSLHKVKESDKKYKRRHEFRHKNYKEHSYLFVHV